MKQKYHLRPWEIWWHRNYRTISNTSIGKFILKKIPKEYLSKIPFEAIPLWIASILTGLLAVFYEWLFEIFEHWGLFLKELTPYGMFLTTPLFFVSSWVLVRFGCQNANGSGIPQLMAASELAGTRRSALVDSLLSIKIIVIKIGSSLLMLLGGGAIGREGPTLQLAGSVFQTVYRLIPSEWSKVSQRIMIITGGASGLAASFNTPLGGIVYVVEELTKSHIGRFRTAVFSAVIISGMTAQLFLGSYLYLGFPKIKQLPLPMIGIVIILAFLAGLLGAYFAKFSLFIVRLRKKLKTTLHQVLSIVGISLLFVTLVYFTNDFTMGTGKALINDILFRPNHQQPWYSFPARFLGSLLSFSVGGAGGIFATSLSSGATLGHLVVDLTNIPIQHHNIMVLVCMIGFLTGITRSPFTSAILVLEMTDRHSAIFYFLLAGIVSNLGASFVLAKSFYEIQKEAILELMVSKTLEKE